eukprot:gene64300-87936_t
MPDDADIECGGGLADHAACSRAVASGVRTILPDSSATFHMAVQTMPPLRFTTR